ncbi:hypothetical protein M9H77_11920 [Catharanthus roseus]|uniref:Uncharacterized protein n=1 Tax=Catharanthus roseus TaxID=4058 RepID=A0ACC0BFZ1_CATRO|nr:hypothetical protein M9H77_11920 [Catharanthus roseus]
MVAFMEEVWKNKFEELKIKEILPNCSQYVKMAKYWRRVTLPPTVALPLPSSVGFCQEFLGRANPTASILMMSTDGHLPIQSHQEATSDPTRMNLNETLRSMQQSIEGLARQFQRVARDVEELKKGKISGYQGRPQVRGERREGLGGRGYHGHKKSFQDMKHGMKITCINIMEIIVMLAKRTMVASMVIKKVIKL